MKSPHRKKKILVFLTVLFFIGSATSQSSEDKVKRVIDDLQSGDWMKKGKSARRLAKMTEIPVEEKLRLLFEVLEKECKFKTSDKKPVGSYKTISVYLKDQYIFALAEAGVKDPAFIIRHLDKAKGEFRDRLILSLGSSKFKDDKITSRIIQLAQNSQDGYIRALATRTLGEWEDPNLIPILKTGLKDKFKVDVKTDLITPNTYKGEDGYYYFECYPVRNEAASAIRKLERKRKEQEEKKNVKK